MADIDISPEHLSRTGGKLGDFGQKLASGGQKLEDAGQKLISSASSDKSGIGAVVAKAFGEGVKITGKVFHEGGGWAERAGKRLHTHGQLHQHNDEEHAKKFKGIHPDEHAKGAHGGGATKARPVSGGSGGAKGGKLRGALGNIRNSGKSLKNKLGFGCGDPVDPVSGDVLQTHVDVSLPGVLPLVLERTHLSSYRVGELFGPSWASTLDQRVEVESDAVYLATEDGMLLVYPRTETGVAELPTEGPRWRLTGSQQDGYSVTDPETGHTRHFAVTIGAAPLIAVTDRNGNRVDIDRDDAGRPTMVRHSGGYRVKVDCAQGRVTALHLLDAGTEITLLRYSYDERGQLSEVVNSSGQPARFEYDAAGRLARWQDRNGMEYRYTYDDQGRCVRTAGADGYLDGTFDYEDGLTRYTDSLGATTTFRLNDLYQVIAQNDPLGNVTTSDWDRYDRLLSRTDPLGRTTSYHYDEVGNLVGITRPDGVALTAEYDESRQPVAVVAADGATWRHEYDERGNLVAVTDPAGARTGYDYDERGGLVAVTDALGNTRSRENNAAGLAVAMTDPLGAVTRFDYDAFGQITAITDPAGGVTRSGWTVEGLLAWQVLPDGATERWKYDGEGNCVERTDAAGNITRSEYASFDLPVARTEPDGTTLRFGYDTELRLSTVTNGQGQVWRYEYDPAGNLVREKDFNDRVLSYRFDAAGQLVERVNGMGQSVAFTRDRLGNVVEQRTGDAVTTFEYDRAGKVIRAAGPDAELAFEYDELGRVTAETCNGRTVSSSYDLLGRRVRRRTPSGAESVWEYDANDQLTALHSVGNSLRFSYDRSGREIKRQLGAATLTQTWDNDHRLRTQALTTQVEQREHLLQRRAYTYRPDGVVTAIVDQATGPREFDLDRAGRVTAVRGNGWVERYAYGATGQLVHAEWPAGEDAVGDREYAGTLIQRAGGVRYQHDPQGRVVVKQRKRLSTKPDTWHYEWDADDRLVDLRTPDGQQWRYRYDPFGRRIAKQRLDGSTVVEQVDFSWDGPVLAEQTSQSRTTTWNFHAGSYEPIAQADRDASQDWVDAQFYAIVTDMVGTPTELVTPGGDVAWQARTTLWGNPSFERGRTDTPLRFPGQYHDRESGLNYNYVRYYDPQDGRYVSGDPLGLDPAPDPHAYVSNPTGWVDPLGLAGIKWKCAEKSENVSREKKPNPKNKLTNAQQRDMAKFMGLTPAKGTVRSNPVFTDGKYYYVWDHDGHRGAAFKAATSIEDLNSKQSRAATVGIGRTIGTKGPWFLYRAGD